MNGWPDRAAGQAPAALSSRLGQEVVERLGVFVDLVTRWGAAIDLVAAGVTRSDLWRLVEESLAATPFLPETGRLVDVGSGGGIPAVPLLVARMDLEGVLLEPRERRWAFLSEVVRELALRAEVRRQRLDNRVGGGFAAMTVRGLNRASWEPYSGRVLRPGGVVVWWTGSEEARAFSGEGVGRVLLSPLAREGSGTLVVWTPCST